MDDSHKEETKLNVVTVSVKLLCNNRQLALVALAHGLQVAAADVAGAFDLGPDPYHTWKEKGAAIVSCFDFARNLVALFTAPFFGYFIDHVDRRWALLVYGIITFVPTWVYWFTDLNTTQSLWANHYASVFAAVGSTSQVGFALAMDVTPFEDRTLAAGIFYGLSCFISMVLSPLLAVIAIVPGQGWWLLRCVNDFPRGVLIYQIGLVVSFIASVCSISHEVKGSEEESSNTGTKSSVDNPFLVWLDMCKLMCQDKRMARLCLSAAIISFCRTLSLGNNGQFFDQALGLVRNERYVEVNVLRSLASYLVVMPGFVLTGYLAMERGTLKVLRWLVPVTALTLSTGALMEAIPAMWFTVVVEFFLSMTDLNEVPMSRLVAGIARPGKVGEWLGALGLATEMARLVGNLLVAGVNTLFMFDWRSDMPLWAYYPACGLLTLLAVLPILGTPKTSFGWGPAAGSRVEQLKVQIAVIGAARKWQGRVAARRKLTGASHAGCPPDPRAAADAAGDSAEEEGASSSSSQTESSDDGEGSEEGCCA